MAYCNRYLALIGLNVFTWLLVQGAGAAHCLWLDPSAISGYPEHTIKFSDEFGIFFQKHSWKIPS